jgi:hypothetical protein
MAINRDVSKIWSLNGIFNPPILLI